MEIILAIVLFAIWAGMAVMSSSIDMIEIKTKANISMYSKGFMYNYEPKSTATDEDYAVVNALIAKYEVEEQGKYDEAEIAAIHTINNAGRAPKLLTQTKWVKPMRKIVNNWKEHRQDQTRRARNVRVHTVCCDNYSIFEFVTDKRS